MNPNKMTKKDFEAIAAVFVDAFEDCEDNPDVAMGDVAFDTAYNLAFALADVLCGTNDAFNPALFLQSTGISILDDAVSDYSPRMNLRMRGIEHRGASS